MAKTRSRSGGVRNPGRNASIFGVCVAGGIALVLLGLAEARATGVDWPRPLRLGLFALALGTFPFVYFAGRLVQFRNLRSGRTAFARWTVPAAEFDRFRADQAGIPDDSILVNFYRPPRTTPDTGVEVVFSDRGVLIGDGYFPLSTTGGRRVHGLDYVDGNPPMIAFDTLLTTSVRTSRYSTKTVRVAQAFRVPVAGNARRGAATVIRRYRSMLDPG